MTNKALVIQDDQTQVFDVDAFMAVRNLKAALCGNFNLVR